MRSEKFVHARAIIGVTLPQRGNFSGRDARAHFRRSRMAGSQRSKLPACTSAASEAWTARKYRSSPAPFNLDGSASSPAPAIRRSRCESFRSPAARNRGESCRGKSEARE